MKYRPEVDGLRAIAVVPVVLFHSGLGLMPGGFIGVDIFFVISGFLITSIISSELERDQFSLVSFYERRARRILPALVLVCLVCVPFAWAWLLPRELKDFGQSLAAVATFSSNILFWREEGYFSAAAELKPLLHTWSLAVEEQFYILFPPALWLAYRLARRHVVVLLVLAAIVSLALSEWGWRTAPSANFFLLPSRAWELLIGAIAALVHWAPSRRIANGLSLLGLVLVAGSLATFSEAVPMPSALGLFPIVGTALILLFGRTGTWVAALLSLKPFVWIGLISYSAYLWHQPLFAFARIRSISEPAPALMLALCALSLLLAWLSWRFVEAPWRPLPLSPLSV
ncbi:MAG: acyltransferase [Caulobacter sp.]|nr:acyltransferase [Caulobacter sp.]